MPKLLNQLSKTFFSLFLSWGGLFASKDTTVRAAIDIGSGGPKLRIAEIHLPTQKVKKTLFVKQFPVPFQDDLSRSDNRELSHTVMNQGIATLKEALVFSQIFKAENTAIVGTSVFRNATNGKAFALKIEEEVGFKVHILDQEEEGKLAFQSALAHLDVKKEHLLAWDIGGGSTQFIITSAENAYYIEKSDEGSGPFRDFILEKIQNKDLKEHLSPNPLSLEESELAEKHARFLASKLSSEIKNKIASNEFHIVGVGSVFGRGLSALLGRKSPFTLEDLQLAVDTHAGKTDLELGGGHFASIEVSNALLVLGFMKELKIPSMQIVDVNNAEGAMFYIPFWE